MTCGNQNVFNFAFYPFCTSQNSLLSWPCIICFLRHTCWGGKETLKHNTNTAQTNTQNEKCSSRREYLLTHQRRVLFPKWLFFLLCRISDHPFFLKYWIKCYLVRDNCIESRVLGAISHCYDRRHSIAFWVRIVR